MSNTENIMTDITVADVQLMLQIIEACSKRGAFLPTEFVVIGNLTNKLSAVITAPDANADRFRSQGDDKAADVVDDSNTMYKLSQEAAQLELPLP